MRKTSCATIKGDEFPNQGIRLLSYFHTKEEREWAV